MKRDSTCKELSSSRTEDDVRVGEAETIAFVAFSEDLFREKELEESFAVTSIDVGTLSGVFELIMTVRDDLREHGSRVSGENKEREPGERHLL